MSAVLDLPTVQKRAEASPAPPPHDARIGPVTVTVAREIVLKQPPVQLRPDTGSGNDLGGWAA
ncbi:hypothetical protein ACFYUJ_38160 [Streptomyces sp. NPDC004520]|uniref:hypothetical protein n=1 Tax=Streptomyces sp. NPDC004520 TaxID=3364702 RepID=UPI00367767D1